MITVVNQISGKTFQTNEGEIILDAALAQGLNFPYGCQNGFCGKCKATIIEGEVGYKEGEPQGLSPEEAAENMALLCKCHAKSDIELVVAELESLADIEVKNLPCKVDEIKHLNHDVAQVFLKIPEGKALQYLPGQYIDLIHPEFEPRAFSIANAPTNNGLIELHVRLIDGGKFTNFVFNELEEKSLLRIEGPKGDFYLREATEKPIILLAGGTGFGPVKAIIEHMIESNTNREVHLYWGVRDEVDLYTNLPQEWSEKHTNIRFIPVLSEANSAWQGRTGYVHEAVLSDFDNLTNYEVYACGPPQMVKSAAASFMKKGMFKDDFFSDAFEFAFEGDAK